MLPSGPRADPITIGNVGKGREVGFYMMGCANGVWVGDVRRNWDVVCKAMGWNGDKNTERYSGLDNWQLD